jgi:hypothetical protein
MYPYHGRREHARRRACFNSAKTGNSVREKLAIGPSSSFCDRNDIRRAWEGRKTGSCSEPQRERGTARAQAGRLVLRQETTDAAVDMLVRRLPAMTSVQVKSPTDR